MNNFLKIAPLLLLLMACSPSDRYRLQDKGYDNTFLSEFIFLLSEERKISDTPLVVLDGKLYRYDIELKESPLPVFKNDIVSIAFADAGKAEKLYGKDGSKGAVIIITRKNKPSE
jgi:hypothetical protein